MSRVRWDLQRFGMTPAKLAARLRAGAVPRIAAISLPKAGTHLLERTLCLHPRLYRRLIPTVNDANLDRWGGLADLLNGLRPGQLAVCHLEHDGERARTLAASGARGIFVVRDPRDIVVSQFHYIKRSRKHPFHRLFARVSTLEEGVRMALDGVPDAGFPSVGERLERYAGWLEDAGFVVRFEDLVGASGGGSADTQTKLIDALFDYLGLGDDALTQSLRARIFSSSSPTFRKGRIGGWRHELDEATREEFERRLGSWLTLYGYGGRGESAG